MISPSLLNNKHLLWRAGFGPGISQLEDLHKKDIKSLINDLFKEETFLYVNYDTPDIPETGDYMMNDQTPAEK